MGNADATDPSVWRQLRATEVQGLARVQCLRLELLELLGRRHFSMRTSHAGSPQCIGDGKHARRLPARVSRGQVPGVAMRHMAYVKVEDGITPEPNSNVGTYRREWSAALVDNLISLASRNGRISPMDYPYAAELHYAALRDFPITARNVFVAGSISPWVEAICISRGAARVVTVDYNLPSTTSPRLTLQSMSALRGATVTERFDAIFSFSSIEHDGLGRYGDPVNPLGDVAAMGEFALLLRPSGLLYLGLPIARSGAANGGARFYDGERFRALSAGWDHVATYWSPCCPIPGRKQLLQRNESEAKRWHSGESFWRDAEERLPRDEDWRHQPVFVLRPTAGALRAALERVGRGAKVAASGARGT